MPHARPKLDTLRRGTHFAPATAMEWMGAMKRPTHWWLSSLCTAALLGAVKAESALVAPAPGAPAQSAARLDFAIHIPAVLRLESRLIDDVRQMLPPDGMPGTARLRQSPLANLRELTVTLDRRSNDSGAPQRALVYTYAQL